VVEYNGQGNAHGVDEPIPTATGADRLGLADFVLNIRGGNDAYTRASGIDTPIPTVTAESPTALVNPFVIQMEHSRADLRQSVKPVSKPMPVITSADGFALADPFVVQMEHSGDASGHGRRVHPVDEPTKTVTARGALGLADPVIVPTNHGSDDRAYSISEPMKTVTALDAWGLAQSQIAGSPRTVRVDWDALEAKFYKHAENYLGPIEIAPGVFLDVLFRMFMPRELARAQGFADEYQITGTRDEQVKQIGNAVPVNTAEALCTEILRMQFGQSRYQYLSVQSPSATDSI
jgi:DNA (cytosine-5)-methyltransferase 1